MESRPNERRSQTGIRFIINMSEEIINRVTQSALEVIDLEDFYPKGERMVLDLKPWLYESMVLREKEFRNFVLEHDWSQYQDAYIAVYTSADAIIPYWAYILVSLQLSKYAKKVVKGSLEDLETVLYETIINQLDVSPFEDKPVIIKGCSKKPVPQNAYIFLANKLSTVAKSIMYGEACSAVPLFKKK